MKIILTFILTALFTHPSVAHYNKASFLGIPNTVKKVQPSLSMKQSITLYSKITKDTLIKKVTRIYNYRDLYYYLKDTLGHDLADFFVRISIYESGRSWTSELAIKYNNIFGMRCHLKVPGQKRCTDNDYQIYAFKRQAADDIIFWILRAPPIEGESVYEFLKRRHKNRLPLNLDYFKMYNSLSKIKYKL